jgi:hypothetical protein
VETSIVVLPLYQMPEADYVCHLVLTLKLNNGVCIGVCKDTLSIFNSYSVYMSPDKAKCTGGLIKNCQP